MWTISRSAVRVNETSSSKIKVLHLMELFPRFPNICCSSTLTVEARNRYSLVRCRSQVRLNNGVSSAGAAADGSRHVVSGEGADVNGNRTRIQVNTTNSFGVWIFITIIIIIVILPLAAASIAFSKFMCFESVFINSGNSYASLEEHVGAHVGCTLLLYVKYFAV